MAFKIPNRDQSPDDPYRVDDAALRKAINAGRDTQGYNVPNQTGRLLFLLIVVGVGIAIIGIYKILPTPETPTTAPIGTLSQQPSINSAPNSAQRSGPTTPTNDPAPTSTSAPPPPDFRGVKWGSSPAQWMQNLGSGVWKNSKKQLPSFMNVPVAEEAYLFENNKLYAGEMFFDGAENFETLKTTLRNAFGTPTSSNDKLQIYRWQWRNPSFSLKLTYQSKFQRPTIHIEREGSSPQSLADSARSPTKTVGSIDKSPKMQQGRSDLIKKLIREGVFLKTDTPGSLPRVYVGPAFYGLDFDTKQKFVSVVYAYYFDGSGALDMVRVMDGRTNKEIGDFTLPPFGTGLKLH